MTQVTQRAERHDEDLVRVYLDEIGRHELLTKDDEARLAQDIDAGRGRAGQARRARPHQAERPPQARGGGPAGRGRPPRVHPVQPAAGGLDRQEVPGVGAAAPRPRAGGQPRADARGGEVRLAQGLQVLDVRDVVDPPGDHPRHRQHRPYDPAPGPRRRQPAAPVTGPAPSSRRSWAGADRRRARHELDVAEEKVTELLPSRPIRCRWPSRSARTARRSWETSSRTAAPSRRSTPPPPPCSRARSRSSCRCSTSGSDGS